MKEVEDMLRPLRSRNTDLALKIDTDDDHPKVTCQDCPHYTYPVRDAATLSSSIRSIEAHSKSYQHTSSLGKRLASEEALMTTMTSLMLRNPNSKSGSRTTVNPSVPEIFCKICPNWVYSMGTNSVTVARSAAERHLKTFDHERRALTSVSNVEI